MKAASDHLPRAFAFRIAYLALAWAGCLTVARLAPQDGSFALIATLLAWLLPITAPIILALDWRWLTSHPEAVNRWGFKRR